VQTASWPPLIYTRWIEWDYCV